MIHSGSGPPWVPQLGLGLPPCLTQLPWLVLVLQQRAGTRFGPPSKAVRSAGQPVPSAEPPGQWPSPTRDWDRDRGRAGQGLWGTKAAGRLPHAWHSPTSSEPDAICFPGAARAWGFPQIDKNKGNKAHGFILITTHDTRKSFFILKVCNSWLKHFFWSRAPSKVIPHSSSFKS